MSTPLPSAQKTQKWESDSDSRIFCSVAKEVYHVTVRCTDKTNGVGDDSNVTVHLHHHNERHRHHDVTETLCRRPITFQLAENVDGVSLGTLPCASIDLCPHDSSLGCRLVIRGSIVSQIYSCLNAGTSILGAWGSRPQILGRGCHGGRKVVVGSWTGREILLYLMMYR